MKSVASRLSLLDNKPARAFLALFAATIVVASAVLDASADITLVTFEASWQADGTILVVWETSSEFDATTYFLYRAESSDGPWEDPIDFESATGNEFTSATYSFVDGGVSQDVTYYYRLEEVAADGSSTFFGPIVPTTDSTSPAANTPTATSESGLEQAVVPTATRQKANTPLPAGTGTVLLTATRQSTLPATPIKTALTRALTPLVTTPTPVGGVVPTVEAHTPTPEVTVRPERGPIQPAVGAIATAMPTLPPPQATLTPSPTRQQLADTRKETSQPLLDASATQLALKPITKASRDSESNSRLALLLSGGALVAAAILCTLVLLIWRRRAR